jgi:uncharacterized protein involved in outer membrane biogenesis
MSEYQRPPEAQPDRRRIWLIRALVALVVYALIGFLGVPALIKWQLPKQASAQLGRSVSLEDASFNPFTLNLALNGLHVRAADGETDAFAVGQIETELQWRSLFYWGLIFEHLRVDAPYLAFTRLDGGRTNWSDVVERFGTSEASDATPEDEPEHVFRFSINNIRLSDGRIDIDDQPAGLKHTVSNLVVGIPFISGFPAQVERYVQPELSANINGTPLQVSGRALPFDEKRTTVVDIQLAPFDVAPYLAYLPYTPAFAIRAGQLSTALELAFEQADDSSPRLTLVGSATLTDLSLTDLSDGALIDLPRVEANLREYDIFAGRMHLADITFTSPDVHVARNADGSGNWQALVPPSPASAPEAKPADANTPPQAADSEAPAFVLKLDRFDIRNGRVAFADAAAPAGRFSTRITALNASLEGLDTASEQPARLTLNATTEAGETLSQEGTLNASPLAAQGRIQLDGVPVTQYAPYYANQLTGAAIRGGVLGATIPYRFADGMLKIDQAEASLTKFSLALDKAKQPAIEIASLALDKVDLDLAANRLDIGEIKSAGGVLRLARLRDGSVDLAAIGPPSAPEKRAAPTSKPFAVRIDAINLGEWQTVFADQSVSPAMHLDVGKIALTTGTIDLNTPGDTAIGLNAVVNRSGYLAVKGKTRLDTLDTSLRVDLKALDLRAFKAYIPEAQEIDIRSARASLGGQLTLAALRTEAPQIRYRGDVDLSDLIARDTINDTDFLRWKALSFDGLDVSTAPLSLGVGTVRLADFYSRLILDAQGRLNFRELTGTGTEAAGADTSGATNDESTAVVAPPKASLPPIRVDKVELVNGNVQYSDRFVRPNYDANLTELKGTLDGLKSEADSVATLSLTAALDHGAPVEITGQLNPLRQDRYLDILATVRGFQLPTISTYAGKYIGYGIAKGQLSADLTYKINDRVLTAQNHVLLDQLTFGDKVDSKDAVNLPVQLAVALLKNSKGEIDLSVPVSGTLDDPKFSVGGLVWRAFFNLIVKAVTSPFALLGSVFGGGEELAYVDYPVGSARLPETSVKKLETLAKALTERPALKIEITGRVDPVKDAQGLRELWLENRMREVRRDQLVDAGKTPPPLDEIDLPTDQRDALLAEAYDAADIEKPRNLIGLAKSLPPEQMRELMLKAAPAGPDDLAELGKHRAQSVRDWLVGVGKISAARIFLVPPKTGDAAEPASRVDFSLK